MTGSASLGHSKRHTLCTGTRDRCQLEPRAAAPLTTAEHLNPQLGEVLKHAGSRAMTHGESAAALVAKIGTAEHANGARRRLATACKRARNGKRLAPTSNVVLLRRASQRGDARDDGGAATADVHSEPVDGASARPSVAPKAVHFAMTTEKA